MRKTSRTAVAAKSSASVRNPLSALPNNNARSSAPKIKLRLRRAVHLQRDLRGGRFHPLAEATFLVSAISPDEFKSRKAALKRSQQVFPPVMVLKTGLMHTLVQDQAVRIYQDMALAAFDLFASVIAAPPPISLVFTDWLSIIAALGVGSRPCFTRTCSRSAVWMRSQVPSLRHVRK